MYCVYVNLSFNLLNLYRTSFMYVQVYLNLNKRYNCMLLMYQLYVYVELHFSIVPITLLVHLSNIIVYVHVDECSLLHYCMYMYSIWVYSLIKLLYICVHVNLCSFLCTIWIVGRCGPTAVHSMLFIVLRFECVF